MIMLQLLSLLQRYSLRVALVLLQTPGGFTRNMQPLFTVEGSLKANKGSPHVVFPYAEVQ